MNFASIGASIWSFLQKIPGWVFLALGAVVLGKLYLEGEKSKAVQRNNEKRDKEAAEVVTEVVTNITENTNDVIREADAVRSHTATVELPDGSQALPDYHYRD